MKSIFLVLLFTSFINMRAQEVKRPPVWGIARMTFLVSDFENARSYYGRFLGFDECFSYMNAGTEVICFKVNDRQFLEFIQDRDCVGKTRLVSLSFETDDIEQMRIYLRSEGVEVPESVTTDGAGNDIIKVTDPSGNQIEFIQYKPASLHRKSEGRCLSENRISRRIHHAGLYSEKVMDNDPFYAGILNFKEMWRYPESRDIDPAFLYLVMPECTENIELLNSGGPNTGHPCLLVDDMQETIYTLRMRRLNEVINNPSIGRGNRWLLNITDPDNNKVEFTEAHTVR